MHLFIRRNKKQNVPGCVHRSVDEYSPAAGPEYHPWSSSPLGWALETTDCSSQEDPRALEGAQHCQNARHALSPGTGALHAGPGLILLAHGRGQATISILRGTLVDILRGARRTKPQSPKTFSPLSGRVRICTRVFLFQSPGSLMLGASPSES